MWKLRKNGDAHELEGRLRSGRPEAPDAFVDRLSQAVVTERRAAPRAWSKLAFASAVTVFMLGTFASFGGLGYAASGAAGTYHAVKQVASGKLLVSVKKSSASDQYPSKPSHKTPPVSGTAGVQQSLGATKASGTLPFTGLSLLGTFIASLAMIAAGVALRRRERQN